MLCLEARDCVVPNLENVTVAGVVVKHKETITVRCAEGHYLLYGQDKSGCLDGSFYPSLQEVLCYGTVGTALCRIRLLYTSH